MENVTRPEHFPDILPTNLLELPRAVGATATRGELQRLYADWAMFHREALSGQYQVPNGRNIDDLGYGVIEIGPAASLAEPGYLRLQHRLFLGEPTVIILQSHRNAHGRGSTRQPAGLVTQPSESLLYQISESRVMFGEMAANKAITFRQRATGPSFLDILHLDGLLCQITTPEESGKKRRVAGRFIDLLKGRLFKRPPGE
ncbi:MAG: hypothetical protein ABI602_04075 [Candidatus Saccharibacteria bacterium]